jgi:hypothetical protein
VAMCDVIISLSQEGERRVLAVQKNRLNEAQMGLSFGVFSDEGRAGEGLSYLILLEKPDEAARPRQIAKHAKAQMRKFLCAHAGEKFGRKALIEALAGVMPLPKERNLNEAFAELGKDWMIRVGQMGKEKLYWWENQFQGYGISAEGKLGLGDGSSLESAAEALEKLGNEAVQKAVEMAVGAGMDEKAVRAMVKD